MYHSVSGDFFNKNKLINSWFEEGLVNKEFSAT